tara:strand:+ start:186 stop:1142 length:957 start_codon:yes stop_codon:yes gene_type:complete
MYPVETRNNFLVLTPDGVGSTYLQRALTVYLQSAELDYWNTHELLNGLTVEDGNLYKDFTHEYTQTVEDICNKLLITGNFLVSRIAHYHIKNRLAKREENYADLYKECNRKFNTIIFCARDPFEYALSWGIRNKSGKLNVYSVTERIEAHGVGIKEPIDLDFFQSKLDQYAEYEYWAQDNFDITHTVNYDALHQDVDSVMQTITNMTHTTFLQGYNRLRYTASKSKDNKINLTITNESFDGICKMYSMIDRLYNTKRLPTPMPLKMNTMSDKQKRVTNFSNAIDVYNTWALKGNRHAIVTEEIIRNKIVTEKQIYVDK